MAKIHKTQPCGDLINKVIGYPQSETNRTQIIPVRAMSDYELALASGEIPAETTLQEWLNRPLPNPAPGIIEYGDNV